MSAVRPGHLNRAGLVGPPGGLRLLEAEFDLTMGLAGCASICEIGREMLEPAGFGS